MLTDYQIGEVYLAWDAKPGTSMADFARAIEAEVRKDIAARIVALRDSHCIGVNGDCADDGSNCDFVAAWNDVLEVVRTQPAPGGAG